MFSAWIRRHAANFLTLGRIALTPVFVWCVVGGRGAPAAALFPLVAASDFFDGRIARRYDTAGEGGRFLDHGADISFILAALGAYAWLGVTPWWVPASISAAFAFYVVDSWWRTADRRPTLVGSRIGHATGVLNYGLVGVLVYDRTLDWAVLPAGLLQGLYWLVPIYCAAAIAHRLGTGFGGAALADRRSEARRTSG